MVKAYRVNLDSLDAGVFPKPFSIEGESPEGKPTLEDADVCFGSLLRTGFLSYRQRSVYSVTPSANAVLMRPQPLTDSSPAMEAGLSLAHRL